MVTDREPLPEEFDRAVEALAVLFSIAIHDFRHQLAPAPFCVGRPTVTRPSAQLRDSSLRIGPMLEARQQGLGRRLRGVEYSAPATPLFICAIISD
jgi:hypothetical protein